jgi:uncharacterized RDD family membrane protein YckC
MSASDSVLVRTPEGIEFALPLAGFFSRMLAFTIDLAVILAAGTLIGRLTAALQMLNIDTFQAIFMVVYFATSLLYGMLTEWLWRGQTVGKRMLGLRVVEASGLRLRPAQIIVRNLLRFVDLLPGLYLVGGVACVSSPRRQRLGDIAAGTIVIRTPKLWQPDVEQLLGARHNSLAEHRHLAARLRQKVQPQVGRLALEAVLRRDQLEPAARIKLFRAFSDYFEALVPFPAEVSEQLSPEQYVRNAVEVLFTKPAKQTASLRGPLADSVFSTTRARN